MASPSLRLDTNVDGDFFVDETCIDCSTCYWMAPDTFDRSGDHSHVHHQPGTPDQLHAALQALVSCPTASIGTAGKHDLRPVVASFPIPIVDGVHHCGYHHESSFGAASYLIVRERGNVLVDSPRFTRPLVRRIEELGGVKWMFLTHKDDVADHVRFAEHFGCKRILHEDDLGPGTRDVERRLAGEEVVKLDDEVTFIPVPGHTRGSVCLLYRDRFLFSGDHLAHGAAVGHLYAFRRACWYDWTTQIRSMERLAGFDFEWVLPGHGRRAHHPVEEMRDEMARCLAWMRAA